MIYRLKYTALSTFLGAWLFQAFFLSAPSFSDDLTDLKTRVQAVAQENQDLRAELERQSVLNQKQAEMIQNLMEKIAAIEDTDSNISRVVEDIKTTSLAEEAVSAEGPGGMTALPTVNIKGFADITYNAREEVNAGEENANTFSIGQVDLFFSSELTQKLSAITEVVFEFNDNNETILDVERGILKYDLSDLFNVEIGRMHTPLGFWNTAYHHGAWLQTTIGRPLMFEWEDDNGILPVHNVGIGLSGKSQEENFCVRYNLAVVNGRGKTITEIQNVQDGNDAKAFVASVGVEPEAIPGLQFGASVYVDKIPPDTTTAARNGEIEELILGGHAVYQGEKVELLAEGVYLLHDDEVSSAAYDTHGFYLQGAYKLNKWKPYCRWEYLNFNEGDPYFASIDIDNSKYLTGIRWDPFPWNAVKLEYSYQEHQNEDDIHMIRLQSSYTF